jgi:hypothetical protein
MYPGTAWTETTREKKKIPEMRHAVRTSTFSPWKNSTALYWISNPKWIALEHVDICLIPIGEVFFFCFCESTRANEEAKHRLVLEIFSTAMRKIRGRAICRLGLYLGMYE